MQSVQETRDVREKAMPKLPEERSDFHIRWHADGKLMHESRKCLQMALHDLDTGARRLQ